MATGLLPEIKQTFSLTLTLEQEGTPDCSPHPLQQSHNPASPHSASPPVAGQPSVLPR